MKWTVTLICFILFSGIAEHAQAQDSKVTAGEVYFNEGKFALASESLSTALKDTAILKRGNIAKAYFYYARAQFSLFQEAAAQQNLDGALAIDLVDVKNSYDQALLQDKGDLEVKINADFRLLRQWLMQMAVVHMNSKTLDLAESYLQAAIDLKEDYVTYDLLGQVFLNKQDYSRAAIAFDSAIDMLKENGSVKPDILVSYLYYRRALISGYYSGNFDMTYGVYDPTEADRDHALKMTAAADSTLEVQWKLVQENSSNYTEDEWIQLADQYNFAKGDIERLELDLLLQPPAHVDAAIVKFEEILKRKPDNYTMNTAYASLLEDIDDSKAIIYYEKALALDDSKELANFNLASIYMNMAAKNLIEANASEDEQVVALLQKSISDYMSKAKPYFERCLEINPSSLKTVKILKQIAIQLGDSEDYQLYNQIEENILEFQAEP